MRINKLLLVLFVAILSLVLVACTGTTTTTANSDGDPEYKYTQPTLTNSDDVVYTKGDIVLTKGDIYKALKNESYFTLCFQNKKADIWKTIIAYCKDLGFKLIDVSIYDTFGSPFNKFWADFSPKSDIYVTFQKTQKEPNKTYNKTV